MILLPQGPLELAQVKALLDALPVPIWLKDPQSVLLAANAAAMRISPLPEAQLLGTRGELFFKPEQLARTLTHDQETWAAAKVTVRDEEIWSPQLKGQRWWRTLRQPVFDADGKPQYLFSVALDVTFQKWAQAQVDGERHLLEMLNTSDSLQDVLNAFVLSYEQASADVLSSVLLLDADGTRLHCAAGPHLPDAYSQAVQSMPIATPSGHFGGTALTGQEVLVEDIATDRTYTDFRDLAASLGLHASWSVPILSSQGQVLGAFINYHSTAKSPTPEELQTIRRGAHMVGVAVEHYQTQAQLLAGQASLKESALHTQTILDNMADGVVTFNASGVIESFNKAASVMFGYPAVAIIGSDISVLTPPVHHAEYLPLRQKFLSLEVSKTEALTLEFEALRRDGSLFPVSLAVSKITSAGRAIGIGILRDITLSRQNEEEIRRLAFYDPLTELPNRRLLMDRLKQALANSSRNGSHAAVMFLDLDHFKQLNDTLGHDMGDVLLKEVARRLKGCVREVDSVARLGGDEFVVLMEALSSDPQEAAMQAESVALKVLAALGQPYALGEHSHSSTPSIGIVVFLAHEHSLEDLLKNADVAMYQAKTAGRNTIRFFDPVTQAAIAAQTALERDLRRGLADEEFVLHYQPQVNGSGVTVGNEALVRWKHHSRGMVPPAQFIPLAESTGLILPLGQWVLETACAQLMAWSTHPTTTRWTLSVNVSASQFAQPDFVSQVLRALEKTGANPHRLKLELTESMLVNDVDDIIEKMHTIKGSGVGFSLDDFGTGYSSLTYLKRLPLDQLKIDQSFVHDVLTDPSDAVIARTVVALGHSLGLTVIAEGVETAEQAEFLSGIGCDAFQGYYYGRPGPATLIVAPAQQPIAVQS